MVGARSGEKFPCAERRTGASAQRFGNAGALPGARRACGVPRRGGAGDLAGAENPRGTGYTLLLLGVVAEDQGDYDAALPLLEEALTIFQETGYQALAAQTQLPSRGRDPRTDRPCAGNVTACRRHYRRAVSLAMRGPLLSCWDISA